MAKKNFLKNLGVSKEMLELEGFSDKKKNFREQFFNAKSVADISMDPNGNIEGKSLINYKSELPKYMIKLDSMEKMHSKATSIFGKERATEMLKAHLEGEIYINDLSGFDMPYCYNFSTQDIALNGLPFFADKKSQPPKNLISFMDQVIQFSIYASNSVLGAVGLADLLVVMAHYFGKLKREGEVTEAYALKLAGQKIQSFIYACNQPYTRGANQSGFYNISLYDNPFLDAILINYAALEIDRADVLQLQALFLDVMNETFKTTPLTFPIISACFNTDKANKIVDIEYFEEVCIANTEFAFINFYFGKTSTLSSCCRLRSDTEYFNLFGGGGGTKIGSLGVVTLNLPRIAQATNFSAELERLVRLANDINLVKRKLIEEYIELGALPLYTHDFMALNTQYSTVGLVGINEMLENLGLDILDKKGQDFVAMVQADINKQIDTYAKLTGNPHNLEQVPAENSAIKLAQKDKAMGFNNKYEIYSNQFIPLTTNADILDRIKLQGMFDSKMSGGSILHINIDEEMAAGDMIDLVSAAANKGVIYMGINYNLQKCEEGHIVPHRGDKCPICGAGITDNFIRVVGFIVNTKNFHRVRREGEYTQRKFYQF